MPSSAKESCKRTKPKKVTKAGRPKNSKTVTRTCKRAKSPRRSKRCTPCLNFSPAWGPEIFLAPPTEDTSNDGKVHFVDVVTPQTQDTSGQRETTDASPVTETHSFDDIVVEPAGVAEATVGDVTPVPLPRGQSFDDESDHEDGTENDLGAVAETQSFDDNGVEPVGDASEDTPIAAESPVPLPREQSFDDESDDEHGAENDLGAVAETQSFDDDGAEPVGDAAEATPVAGGGPASAPAAGDAWVASVIENAHAPYSYGEQILADVKQLLTVTVNEWVEEARHTVGLDLDVADILVTLFRIVHRLLHNGMFTPSVLQADYLSVLPKLQVHATDITSALADTFPLLDGSLIDPLTEIVRQYIKVHTDIRISEKYIEFVGELGPTKFDANAHSLDIGGDFLRDGDTCFVVFPGITYQEDGRVKMRALMYVLKQEPIATHSAGDASPGERVADVAGGGGPAANPRAELVYDADPLTDIERARAHAWRANNRARLLRKQQRRTIDDHKQELLNSGVLTNVLRFITTMSIVSLSGSGYSAGSIDGRLLGVGGDECQNNELAFGENFPKCGVTFYDYTGISSVEQMVDWLVLSGVDIGFIVVEGQSVSEKLVDMTLARIKQTFLSDIGTDRPLHMFLMNKDTGRLEAMSRFGDAHAVLATKDADDITQYVYDHDEFRGLRSTSTNVTTWTPATFAEEHWRVPSQPIIATDDAEDVSAPPDDVQPGVQEGGGSTDDGADEADPLTGDGVSPAGDVPAVGESVQQEPPAEEFFPTSEEDSRVPSRDELEPPSFLGLDDEFFDATEELTIDEHKEGLLTNGLLEKLFTLVRSISIEGDAVDRVDAAAIDVGALGVSPRDYCKSDKITYGQNMDECGVTFFQYSSRFEVKDFVEWLVKSGKHFGFILVPTSEMFRHTKDARETLLTDIGTNEPFHLALVHKGNETNFGNLTFTSRFGKAHEIADTKDDDGRTKQIYAHDEYNGFRESSVSDIRDWNTQRFADRHWDPRNQRVLSPPTAPAAHARRGGVSYANRTPTAKPEYATPPPVRPPNLRTLPARVTQYYASLVDSGKMENMLMVIKGIADATHASGYLHGIVTVEDIEGCSTKDVRYTQSNAEAAKCGISSLVTLGSVPEKLETLPKELFGKLGNLRAQNDENTFIGFVVTGHSLDSASAEFAKFIAHERMHKFPLPDRVHVVVIDPEVQSRISLLSVHDGLTLQTRNYNTNRPDYGSESFLEEHQQNITPG